MSYTNFKYELSKMCLKTTSKDNLLISFKAMFASDVCGDMSEVVCKTTIVHKNLN